jgi:hypothetical protein
MNTRKGQQKALTKKRSACWQRKKTCRPAKGAKPAPKATAQQTPKPNSKQE